MNSYGFSAQDAGNGFPGLQGRPVTIEFIQVRPPSTPTSGAKPEVVIQVFPAAGGSPVDHHFGPGSYDLRIQSFGQPNYTIAGKAILSVSGTVG